MFYQSGYLQHYKRLKDFKILIRNISLVHNRLQQQAANAVNQALTIRNWLIGHYIVEYEQNGKDRAEYGTQLLSNLAIEFKNVKGLDERSLRNFRRLYLLYPQIGEYLTQGEIWGSLSPILKQLPIRGSLSPVSYKSLIAGLTTKLSTNLKNRVSGKHIITKLSYSHLELLIKIDDDLKRTFYELECVKGTWSVRELKRQIASLYYERCGLSFKPEKLSELVQKKIRPETSADIIKNIYAFEFLNLNVKDVVEESDLETALIDNELKKFK